MKTTSVRLPEEYIKEIDRISNEEGLDRGTLLRRFIGDALREHKIKKALERYREGKISLWKAASIAGISYRAALEELKKRNIPFSYEKEDLERDLKWATE
jgi:predicted HTH domain antitoxin